MKRKELLKALCELASDVGRKAYHSKYAYDCFCKYRQKEKGTCYTFSFDNKILRYIEDAVAEKLERDNDNEQPNKEGNVSHGDG